MGDGILDGYPIIQDQTSPNLAHIPTTNLYLNSEPTTSEGPDNGITYVSYNWGVLNFSNAVSFGDNSTTRYRYGATVLASTKYTVSAFVIMDDLSEPTPSVVNNSGDFNLTVSGKRDGTLHPNQYIGNNIWRVSMTRISETVNLINNGVIKYTGQSTKGFKLVGFQIEEQSQATAYLKSDGIAAVRKSSTTNLIPYSEDFSSYDQIQNITLIPNATTSPTGTSNATKVLSTGTNSKIRDNIPVVSGTTYTFSVFCKNIDATLIKLLAFDGVNLFQSDVTSQVSTTEWTRISITFTAGNTSSSGQLQFARDLPNTQSAFFWGVQFEEQTQAETYAKTTGLPVTIDLFTENNYGTMTNMSASDIVEDTPNN